MDLMNEVDVAFEKQFTTIDYIFLVCILGISFVIGITTSFSGNKTPEEFLLGNRSFSPYPVSLSLLTTVISAVNIVGLSTEVYVYGTQLSLMAIGTMAGIAFSIVIIMPVIYPLKVISIHEYIDARFNSPLMQILMMSLIVFNALVWIGLALYATSIALAAVSPIDSSIFILVIGCICTIYSTIGGIRAVVWTDVFQFWVMIGGLLVIVIAGCLEVGGIKKLLQIASEGNRLQFFNMNPSIYERHNFYNTLTFGAFIYGAMFSISQINTQRICAVGSLKDAQLVLKINMIGMALIQVVIFFGGLVAYAAYAGCDPKLTGMIGKRNEILSFMIVDKLRYIYGLPGVYVATMIASTLSTFSSVLNAQVAIIWKDLLCRMDYFANAKPWLATLINKLITVIVGIGFIIMAFVTSKASSIIQLVLSAGGIVFGSIFGVFVLGICFPKSNVTGAWCGFVTSVAFCTWICVGNLLYGTTPDELPFSTSLCGNQTALNWTQYELFSSTANATNEILLTNDTASSLTKTSLTESSSLLYFYDISYTLYSVLAPLLTIIIGLAVSYMTNNKSAHEVPSELISPILHRFYYKKLVKDGQPF